MRSGVLFVLTVGSVFYTAWHGSEAYAKAPFGREALGEGAAFTFALLAILVTHELGHYVAARIHRVPASPPYFLPMPYLSPFGTMGAVIRMKARIPTRSALLDIGAAGPLAGLVVAIPMYLWGAKQSHYVAITTTPGLTLGESILTKLLDRVAVGAPPPGMELSLSPIAFAAWAGLFVTMINLLPVGQLDGGHVAYALFGKRQNRFAVIVHRSMLALFFVNVGSFVLRDWRAGAAFAHLDRHVMSSMFWLVWFVVLAVLGSLSAPESTDEAPRLSNRTRIFGLVSLVVIAGYGHEKQAEVGFWLAWFAGLGLFLAMEAKNGALRDSSLLEHPATNDNELSPLRKVVAAVTLVFFVLLFLPTPIIM